MKVRYTAERGLRSSFIIIMGIYIVDDCMISFMLFESQKSKKCIKYTERYAVKAE